MCLTCGKHVWYLNPERTDLDWAERLTVKALRWSVWTGMAIVGHRQPYGPEKFRGVSRFLLDKFARTVHGAQVLPDLSSAEEVIDRARQLAVSWCDCRWITGPGDKVYRCIALDFTAEEELRHPKRSRQITVDEAKEIVRSWRARGAMQSIAWICSGAATCWLCNCDEHCTSHKTQELRWGMIPSFFTTELDESSCIGCGECHKWCMLNRALNFDTEAGIPRIDKAMCQGCGLCIDNCPSGALRRVPRETYWDPRVGEVHIPGGLVNIESGI